MENLSFSPNLVVGISFVSLKIWKIFLIVYCHTKEALTHRMGQLFQGWKKLRAKELNFLKETSWL
jgi:hypothetical protein